MKKTILTALTMTATLCTSAALAQGFGYNTGFGPRGAGCVNIQSPSIQGFGPCGNFPRARYENVYTTPIYGGGSVSTYNGAVNGTSYTYTSPLTGSSTTTYTGF